MNLKQELALLASDRRKLAGIDAQIKLAQTLLEATREWQVLQDLKDLRAGKAGDVADDEERIREFTLGAFRATGDKAPAPGVAVKMFKRIKYDAGEALAWCESHAPVFIKRVLDTKAFERAVEQIQDAAAPWAIEYEPRPQIASDLSAYLQAEETAKEQTP